MKRRQFNCGLSSLEASYHETTHWFKLQQIGLGGKSTTTMQYTYYCCAAEGVQLVYYLNETPLHGTTHVEILSRAADLC